MSEEKGTLEEVVAAIQKLLGFGSADDITGVVSKVLGANGNVDAIVDAISGLFGNAVGKADILSVAQEHLGKGNIDLGNMLSVFQGIGEKVGGFDKVAGLMGLATGAGNVVGKVGEAASALTGTAADAAGAVADATKGAAGAVSDLTKGAVDTVANAAGNVADAGKDAAGALSGAAGKVADAGVKAAKQVNLPSKKKKRWPIVVGVLVAVIAVAGVGMFVWHEQPSFCAAICHEPMDEFLVGYDQADNAVGVDKWGNEVANTHAMLAVSHKSEGLTCLSCHEPSIGQQIQEASEWVSNGFAYPTPLIERTLEDLIVNAGGTTDSMGDEFCLKSGCHDTYTRDDLFKATTDYNPRNPHLWLANSHYNLEFACSDCHKSHRASVYTCTQCHADAKDIMPDGWVDYATGKDLMSAAEALLAEKTA